MKRLFVKNKFTFLKISAFLANVVLEKKQEKRLSPESGSYHPSPHGR